MLQQTWFWPDMVMDVKDKLARCIHCLKTKPKFGKGKITIGHGPHPAGPFMHLHLDFISLASDHGYKYVLVIVCKFSRWVEAFPLRTAMAEKVAEILLREFFSRSGICQSLDSDQGTHFTGKGLKTCMKILRVNQKFHVPYRPQSSGMVESQNKSIKMAPRTKLSEYDGGWIKYLPSVLMVMRATLNRTTGLSPFEICMGRPIRCYEQVRQAH